VRDQKLNLEEAKASYTQVERGKGSLHSPWTFFFSHAAELMVERLGQQRGLSGGPGKERRRHRREGDTEDRNESTWPHQQVLEYSCLRNYFSKWDRMCGVAHSFLDAFSSSLSAPRAVSPANISEHDPVTRKWLQDGKGNRAPDYGRHQLQHNDLGSDDVRTGGRTSGGRDEGREGWRDGGWKPGPRPIVEGRYRMLSEPGLANPARAGATRRECDRSPGRDGERGRERERGRSPRQEIYNCFPQWDPCTFTICVYSPAPNAKALSPLTPTVI